MDDNQEKTRREQLEAQYDKYVARFQELLATSQDKGREAMDKAIASSRENLVALGEISADQGKVFGEYLRRDLAQTSKDMQHLGAEAWERLHPARLGAGALATTTEALRLFGHSLLNLSDKTSEAMTYKAGEITSAGTLTCVKCETKLRLTKTTQIEPCLQCAGTIFQKSY